MPLTLGGFPLSVLASLCVKITPCPPWATVAHAVRHKGAPLGQQAAATVSLSEISDDPWPQSLCWLPEEISSSCTIRIVYFCIVLSCIVLHLTICMIWRWGVADSTQPQDKQTPNLAGVPLRTPTRLISVRSWTLKPKLSFCRRIKLPPP